MKGKTTMKKHLVSAIALLALASFTASAHAADRVLKAVKVFKFPYSAIAADAMLPDASGRNYVYIGDMVPRRIVIENNLTAIAGTSVVFKGVTTSDPTNPGATTDPPLVGNDGSTASTTASQTAVGIKSIGLSIQNTADAVDCSNLGTYFGIWADVTSATVSGYVTVTVYGEP
jgi:hypothetical protein